jgi:hypothetical protein
VKGTHHKEGHTTTPTQHNRHAPPLQARTHCAGDVWSQVRTSSLKLTCPGQSMALMRKDLPVPLSSSIDMGIALMEMPRACLGGGGDRAQGRGNGAGCLGVSCGCVGGVGGWVGVSVERRGMCAHIHAHESM